MDKAYNRLTWIIFTLLFIQSTVYTQQWVEKQYEVEITHDIPVGEAIDFAGSPKNLALDIYTPVNDNPPDCGRPLIILIHGGAFIGGDKDAGYMTQLGNDFAARGYVCASVQYRLGLFNASDQVHCNISGWDCLVGQDTAEWYRACFRSIQDVRGAIRFLRKNYQDYNVDPGNIFVIGESAGAFTALNIGYLDEVEANLAMTGYLPDASRPYATIQNDCAGPLGWSTSVNEMVLTRPDLGPLSGDLHTDAGDYKIKAIGSLYGAVFANIFNMTPDSYQPALYLFHQPNDLVVNIGSTKVFKGYSDCASSLLGCSEIPNRPFAHGTQSIAAFLETRKTEGASVPDYYLDVTTNNTDCLGQFLDQTKTGHSLDNYPLRTLNMATFFSQYVDTDSDCFVLSNQKADLASHMNVFPNPFKDVLNIKTDLINIEQIKMYDSSGKEVAAYIGNNQQIPLGHLIPGIYVLKVFSNSGLYTTKVIKH